MGFIINVSLSEDFCLICLSRPFGRNCRGTEGENSTSSLAGRADVGVPAPLFKGGCFLLLRVLEWRRFGFCPLSYAVGAKGQLWDHPSNSSGPSLCSWASLTKMTSSDQGTQPWRGDETWVQCLKLAFEGKMNTVDVNNCLPSIICAILLLVDNWPSTTCWCPGNFSLESALSLFFFLVLSSSSQAEEVRQVHVRLGRRWWRKYGIMSPSDLGFSSLALVQ